ncbi:RNA polymerase III, second largest subunit, partial [Pseudoloma neurophilia]
NSFKGSLKRSNDLEISAKDIKKDIKKTRNHNSNALNQNINDSKHDAKNQNSKDPNIKNYQVDTKNPEQSDVTNLNSSENKSVDKTLNTTEPVKKTTSNRKNDDGIVSPGDIVRNDCLVNKKRPNGSNSSLFTKSLDQRHVHSVLRYNNLIKIKLRETRAPIIGDKFSSRHGQKGVVGRILSFTDLPFNTDGLIPDLIMNPHGFPSRMTVGKIKEMIVGLLGLKIGKRMSCMPFSSNSITYKEIYDCLDDSFKQGAFYQGEF